MINIAIAGVGRWGVHLLRNFREHPQARIVAILDPNPERLAVIAKQFNLPKDVLLTTNWEELQQHPIEAIAIATPATTHYTLITSALNCGYHVLAEKPLTLNPAQSRELCQLAEKQQRQLMVDHTYLFHPAVESGRTIIQAGKLGILHYGYATRTHLGPVRTDVDALWDLAIHDIAIFNTWLGQTPTKVQATGKTWLQSGLPDLVWVTLTYPNNFQAFIHLCWSNPDKQRRLGIVGSLGSLIFDEMLPTPLTLFHGEIDNQLQPMNQHQEIIQIEKGEPLQRVCDRFINSIVHNQPVEISSGWVGARLVEILTAVTESLEGGEARLIGGDF